MSEIVVASHYVVIRGLIHSAHACYDDARLTAAAYVRKHPEDARGVVAMSKTRYEEKRAARAVVAPVEFPQAELVFPS